MVKTTVYLPEDVKSAVTREAARRGVSEAEVIRDAISSAVAPSRPRPRGGFLEGSEPLAQHVDEALEGFGLR